MACCLALLGLGNLPLRDFDEATVARVALELSEKNISEVFLPTIWSQPYLNKPPGLHWLISLSIKIQSLWNQGLPSEFSIRVLPALLSTFVVPLGGLIQCKLRPKDTTSSIITSLILLTLLPVARHGRLAMLDGPQLSAIALLWLFIVSIENTKKDNFSCFWAGISSSFLLLLKPPLIIPSLLVGVIFLFLDKKISFCISWLRLRWFIAGIFPGFAWHAWNFYHRDLGAIFMWWGDGAGRVLTNSGGGSIGSHLGFIVPLIEMLEGGWPWILFLPFGFALAWYDRKTRWGKWILVSQLVICGSIFSLKMQLPWYSHPLWLPFALTISPPLAWLTHPTKTKFVPGQKFLLLIPWFLSILGGLCVLFGLFCLSGFFPFLVSYAPIAIVIGIGWLIGSLLLIHSKKKYKRISIFVISFGSYFGLLLLMNSNFWLWELAETWQVEPISKMVVNANVNPVFIKGNYQRPSLNWYSQQRIVEMNNSHKPKFILTKNQIQSTDNKCQLIDSLHEWKLMECPDYELKLD